jgi:DNA-binding transcriptional LysR family regulator
LTERTEPMGANARYFRQGLRLQHLRIMAALAEVQLVSKVAERLHVTQPAISKQIAEIESALSAPVIYRERNRLFLTEVGQRLASHAQTVMQQLRRAELELEVLSLGGAGHLRIGAVTSLAPTLVAKAVTAFKRVAPRVSISVTEGHFMSLRPLLDRGEIDVAVARVWQPQALPDLEQSVLTTEPIVVVCGRDHPLAKRRRLQWSDTASWPWILPDQQSIARRAIDAFWSEQGMAAPADVIEAQSLPFSVALMNDMPYLGLFPEALALSHAARGDLSVLGLRLGGVLAEGRCFWRHGQMEQNAALRPFLDCLKAVPSRF